MHGFQRCFLFAMLLFYGSVFGRSKGIRVHHQQHSRNNRNNNRPTRSRRHYPSLLSFLSSVVVASVTSETSHIATLHRKLTIDGDAEDDDADEDIPTTTPVLSPSKSQSSRKLDAKRDNVGHNASKKIHVAKSKKKSAMTTDSTTVHASSGDIMATLFLPIPQS